MNINFLNTSNLSSYIRTLLNFKVIIQVKYHKFISITLKSKKKLHD